MKGWLDVAVMKIVGANEGHAFNQFRTVFDDFLDLGKALARERWDEQRRSFDLDAV
jgi:hypothetical protein